MNIVQIKQQIFNAVLVARISCGAASNITDYVADIPAIAAIPELIEALEMILNDDDSILQMEVMFNARAALKKAKGL